MVLYVPAYFGKKMYRSDDQRLMALVGRGGVLVEATGEQGPSAESTVFIQSVFRNLHEH